MAIEAAKLMVTVGAETYQAELNLKRLGNQLTKTAQEGTRSARTLGGSLRDLDRWAGVASGGLMGLAGFAGAGALVGFAGHVASSAVQLAKLGEQATRTEDSFRRLMGQAQVSGDEMLDALRRAAGGAVADTQLMLNANRAFGLGVADSIEEMTALMEVARVRGQDMGLTLDEAFSKLVTGLGRASELILDDLAITFDAEQVYSDYAATLGKTASNLSEVEKKQALVNIVLKEAAETDFETMVSNWERLAVNAKNFRTEVGQVSNALLSPLAGAAADALERSDFEPLSFDAEVNRLAIDALVADIGRYEDHLRDGNELTAEMIMQLAQWRVQLAELTKESAKLAAAPALNDQLAQMQEQRQAAIAQQAADYAELAKLADKLASSLLPDLGPQVFGMVDEWGARWREQFDILTENGYTADQALQIIAVDADRMGQALLDAAGNGALEELTRDAVLAQGGLAGAALAAEDLARAVRAVKGVYASGPLSLDGFDPFGGSIGGGAKKGGAPGSLGPRMADPFEKLVRRMTDFGQAVDGASTAAKGLERALGGIPGLFGASKVTQEQMDLAELGVPQNFADDYLRQLTDEVLNGVDWADVDIQDAARRAGIDPTLPAEAILKMFTQAWNDSSLFANPENLNLLNADAIQAELAKAQASEAGEANLRALFGLGEDETVAAVAALGLDVQAGLTAWLESNGLADAGLATAEALGVGVKDNADQVGGGVTLGLFQWASSKEGDDALRSVGEELAKRVSAAMKVTPSLDLPGGGVPPPGSLGERATPRLAQGTGWFAGGAAWVGDGGEPELVVLPRGSAVIPRSRATGAAPVIMNNYVRSDHDVELIARRVLREAQRGR